MDYNELTALLRSSETAEQIDEKRAEIAELIPEVQVMFEYDQKQKRQCHDLWMHSLNTVVRLPKTLPDDEPNDLLYLAALLHDLGKPGNGVPSKKNPDEMTYPGHEAAAALLTEKIIPRLNAEGPVISDEGIKCLKYYISYHHDMSIRVKRFVRKHIRLATMEQFENLLYLEVADCKAQYKCKYTEERVDMCEYILKKIGDDVTKLFTPAKWII